MICEAISLVSLNWTFNFPDLIPPLYIFIEKPLFNLYSFVLLMPFLGWRLEVRRSTCRQKVPEFEISKKKPWSILKAKMQYGLYLNWYGFLFRDFILKLLLFVDQSLDQCITTFEFDGHGFESLYDIIYLKNSRIRLSVIEI